jgi:hypothetical protein
MILLVYNAENWNKDAEYIPLHFILIYENAENWDIDAEYIPLLFILINHRPPVTA